MPEIDFSNGPLLQGRLFSYLDTQKSRLGTTNFHQIPVNAPKCPMQQFQRDGMMQTLLPKAAGASVKIIAPKVGAVTLIGGKSLAGDEKINGAPSVLFDAVALVLSEESAKMLLGEKAALDFVSDAYAHCKAIGHTPGARALNDKAGLEPDAFFIEPPAGAKALVGKLSTREWTREAKSKLPL